MIKIRALILITLSLFFSKKIMAQVHEKEYLQVYLKEFSIYFLPDSCVCKMNLDLSSKEKMTINLFDCKGKMSFKIFNSKGKLTVEGFYINSLDTLRKYSIGKSAIDGSKKIEVMNYFQPLPEGVWNYYKEGKIIKSVHYKEGITKVTN